MKIAALYDIHGNLPALNALLEELKEVQPDLIVVRGDIILWSHASADSGASRPTWRLSPHYSWQRGSRSRHGIRRSTASVLQCQKREVRNYTGLLSS